MILTYSLWQLRFCQEQKPWKRKETERTYSLSFSLSLSLTHFGAWRGRDGEEKEPLAYVVFPPSTIAKQCKKRHATSGATQASHWSLWLPSMLSRLDNECTVIHFYFGADLSSVISVQALLRKLNLYLNFYSGLRDSGPLSRYRNFLRTKTAKFRFTKNCTLPK